MCMRLVVAALFLLLHCVTGFVAQGPNAPRNPQVPTAHAGRKSSSPLRAGNMASTAGAAAGDLEVKSEIACFGGRLLKCVHQSKATKTPMTFTVFLPPQAAASGPLPVSTLYSDTAVVLWCMCACVIRYPATGVHRGVRYTWIACCFSTLCRGVGYHSYRVDHTVRNAHKKVNPHTTLCSRPRWSTCSWYHEAD